MTLEELLDRLEGVRTAGNGYVAICPAHDDREASLGITEGDEGLMLKCYAGCDTNDVRMALGLEWSDLFYHSVNYAEPEAIYTYNDENGEQLFQAVRFPGKKFRQRHWGENREEIWSMEGVRRVPYRLPEVISAVAAGKTIYVCEGEKDVHALLEAGKEATCNPMGAGKWRPEYAEFLRGANVIIVADRDEPGRTHAETVKASLLGLARAVWVVQAKVGKDAADHLAAGLRVEDMVPLRQPVRRGLVTAREMAEQALDDLELNETDIPGFVLVDSVPLVFRQGRMYALGAYQSDGKSTFAVQGARKIASEGRRGVYFTLEMPERDLRNKLISHRGIPLYMLEEPWRIRYDAATYQRYLDAVEEIGSWNLDIVFDSSMNAEKAASIVRDRESDFVVIDHLHRFGWAERRRFEEQIMGLTNIALEQNVMLLVLCQLRKQTRGKELEVFPRPTIQDFRETSQIADDASIALALWRQRDAAGLSYTGITQAIVLKNRHTTGTQDAAGTIFCPLFDQSRQLFVTPERSA